MVCPLEKLMEPYKPMPEFHRAQREQAILQQPSQNVSVARRLKTAADLLMLQAPPAKPAGENPVFLLAAPCIGQMPLPKGHL